jgi:hypothetical protein
MFRNNPRTKRDARRGAQNVMSTDIADFPDQPVDREFIMWSEAETRWIMSGKDAVSTAEMEARIQELINGAPGTLDTLKELADTLGNPNNIATDVITRLNGSCAKTDHITINEDIDLNDIETKHIKDLNITTSKIGPEAVTTSKIQQRAVGDAQIALNSIYDYHLRTDSVITAKIQNLAVTTSKISTGAVTTMKIGNSQVITEKIADNSITTNKIVNLNVTREKIEDNAIGTIQIENNAITNNKMADNSVATSNIINENVTQEKMADNSVGTIQIINGNVTNSKMANNSIATAQIVNLNVTTDKLENSAVTTEKILNSAVITSKISNLNVTTSKIAYNAVTNDQIAARTIQNNRIVEQTIGNLEMANNSIHTRNILDSSITSEKIAANTILETDISNNAVTTSKIKNLNVTANKLSTNSVVTDKILNRNVTSEKIAQNAVTEFELNTNAVHFEHIKASNVLTDAIANKNVTYAKIQDVPSNSLLVRNSNDAGTLSDIRLNNKQILIGNGMGFTAATLSGDTVIENNGEVLIVNNAITRNKIHDREVTTTKIAANAVTNHEIAVKTILGGATGNIDFDTIHSENIKPGEVKNVNLDTNSVQTLQIADRNVTTLKIANNAVTNNELDDNSVATSNIINLNVTQEKLAANSVNTEKIVNQTVTNLKLAENSISTGKVIDNSITIGKIQQISGNAILVRDTDTTGNLTEKTVNDKELLIGNGSGFTSVTLSKDVTITNSGVVTISDNAVKTNTINSAAVTQAKMANDSVGTNQILQNAVTGGNTGKIALDTIDHTNIKNNAIKTGHITDGAVLTSKILDNQVVMAKLSDALQTKIQSFSQGTGAEPASLDQIAINKTNITANESAIQTLTNGAPELLNTLNELSNAIGDDENFATTITNQIGNRMQKGTADDLASHITENIFGEKRFATAIVGDITGESGTSKKLSVRPDTGLPVQIAGKNFDGTESIQITTADITGLTPGSNHIIEVAERNKLAAIELGSQQTNFTNVESAGGVMTTTDQNISGLKTFSDGIIVPTDKDITGDLTGLVKTANQNRITKVGTLIDLEVTGDILGNADIKASGNFESVNGSLTINTITASGQITSESNMIARNFTIETDLEDGEVLGKFTGNLTGSVTGNADSATKLLKNDLTIAGIPFDGTASINLNGVNQIGNQDTTGNSATTTILKTAVNIGNVSFDGSTDIVPIHTQIALDDASNADRHIAFTTSGEGNKQSFVNTSLKFNPVLQKITVPKIESELTGDVIGHFKGKVLANDDSTIVNSLDKSAVLNSLTLNGNTSFGGNAITGGAGSVITATSLTGTLTTVQQPNITRVGTLDQLTMDGNISFGSHKLIGGTGSQIQADTFIGNVTGVATSATSLDGTLTIAGKDVVFAENGNAVVTIDDLATGGALKIIGDTPQTVLGIKTFNGLRLGNTLDANEQNISNVNIISATSFNGTVSQAAQPSITSLGNLNGLTMTDDIEMSSKNITNANAITSNTFQGRLIGEADTVTNGAYITADNQFGGTNKFLNKLIIGNGIEFQGGDLKLQNSNLDTDGNITCDTITASGSFQGTATFVQDGVYLSTTQTISGNKTFSGSNTFTKSIDAPNGLNGEASSVTDGIYASVSNTFTGTGNEFLNTLSCPSGITGNASSATILRDTKTVGANVGNLGDPAAGGSIGGKRADFNGSQNIVLTPQHVGLSSNSLAINDTTIISSTERQQITTNKTAIANNVTRIDELVGSAPEALDTIHELASYLTGEGGGADGVAGGLVSALAGKMNNSGDETVTGVKTFSDGIVVPAGKSIDGVVTSATSLSSGREIGNNYNWGAKRSLDNETGALIELVPGNVGLVVNSQNQEDMKVITAAERLKIAGLQPDGGINVTNMRSIGVVIETLGTFAEPQIFGGNNAHEDYGFVQFNRETRIPGGISGGPVTIGNNIIESGSITSTGGIICAANTDGTNIGLKTTGIIETTMAAGTGLKIANDAEIEGKLKVNNSILVDGDKFIVSNTTGNVYTAGTLIVGSGVVDDDGAFTDPKTTTLNGELHCKGKVTTDDETLFKGDLTIDSGVLTLFKGDVTIGELASTNDLTIFGNELIKANLTVEANAFLKDNVVVDGVSEFKRNVTFSAALNAAAIFEVNENMTTNINGVANIGGNVTIANKSLTINDGAETPADKFKVTKDGDVTGNKITVVDSMEAGGDLTIAGNSTITGTLGVDSNTVIKGDVTIENKSLAINDGADTPADTFKVTKEGDVTGNKITVVDSMEAGGDLTIAGDSSLTGTLNVTGMITGDITGDLTGQVLTAKQDTIATLDVLTSVGTAGTDTVFKGPIDATAEGFKGDLTGDVTGQLLTAKQDTIATLDVLTSVGTAGTDTVFKGPIDATAEGFKGDITGQVLTAKQDTIATLDVLTSVGTAGTDTVFKGPIDATAEGFKGDITGQVLTAKQDSIATLDALTAVGATTVKTVFKGPIEGKEGIESDLTGQVLTAKQDTIATLDALTSIGLTTVDTVFKGPIDATAEGVKGDLTGQVLTAKQDTIATLDALTSIGLTTVDTAFKGTVTAEEGITIPDGKNLTGDVTLVNAPTDDKHATTKKYVDDEITKLTGTEGLDAALDTLKEIGDYLTDNAVADGVVQQLAAKQDNLTAGHNISIAEVAQTQTFTLEVFEGNLEANAPYLNGGQIADLIGAGVAVGDTITITHDGTDYEREIESITGTTAVVLTAKLADDFPAVATAITVSIPADPVLTIKTTGATDEEKAITFANFTGTVETNKLYLNGDSSNLDFNGAPIKGRLNTVEPTKLMNPYMAIMNNTGIDSGLKTALTDIISALADTIPESFDIGPAMVTMTSTSIVTGGYNNDDTIPLKFAWSEILKEDLVLADLTLVNCTLTDLAIDDTNKRLYTATLTPTTEGPVSVTLKDDVKIDHAGNKTSGQAPFEYTYDVSNPVTTLNIASSNADKAYAKLDNTVTLTINADETIKEPTVVMKLSNIALNSDDITVVAVNGTTESVNGTVITHSDTWTASFSVQTAINDDDLKINGLKTDADALLAQISTNVTDATDNAALSDLATTTNGDGEGAILSLVIAGSTVTSVTVTTAGTGYAIGDTVTVSNELIDGTDTDLVFTLIADDLVDTDGVTGWTDGSMTFSVIATDLAENQADANTTITEADSVSTLTILRSKPVITVVDMLVTDADPEHEDSSFIERLATYTPDKTAVDSAGTVITTDVTEVSTNLDTDVADSTPYEIVYTVTDAAGNVSVDTTVQITVVDTTPPLVALDDDDAEILTVVSNNDDDADAATLAIKDDTVTLTFTSNEELEASDVDNAIETSVTFTIGTTAQTAINLVQKTGSTSKLEWKGVYTVVDGDNGLVSYVIKMTDIYGNVTTTESADSDVTVDTTAPTIALDDAEVPAEIITILSNNDDDADNANLAIVGDVVTLTFTASEELHGTADHNTVVFKVGDDDAKTAVNLVATTGANEYKASMPAVVANESGIVSYVLQLTDLAGNVTTTASADSTVRVDTTAPTVALDDAEVPAEILTVVSNNDDDADDANLAIKDDTVTLTFTASEELHGTADHNTVVFKVGAAAAHSAVNLVATTAEDDGHVYTASFDVAAGENGTVSYVLQLTDLAGNVTTTASADSDCTVDTTAPTVATDTTVSVVSNNDDDADDANLAIKDDTVTLTFTASEELHGTADHNTVVFKVGAAAAKDAINLSATAADDGHKYTASFDVAAGENGTVSYVLQLTDLAGNVTTTASADSNCTVDTTDPGIAQDDAEVPADILSAVNDGDSTTLAKAGNTVTLKFTATEELHGTADHNTVVFKVGDAAAKAAINLSATDNDNEYKADLVFAADSTETGAIKFKLKLTDLAGNEKEDAAFTDSGVTADTTPPTVDSVALSSDNTDTSLAMKDDVISLVFTTSEAMQTPEVTISIGGTALESGVTVEETGESTDKTKWTATHTVVDTTGAVTFSITAKDLAGNEVTKTDVTDSSSVTVDTTAPSLSNVAISSSNTTNTLAKAADTVSLVFVSDEAIQDPTVTFQSGGADIGNKDNVTVAETTGHSDKMNWTASYTVATADTDGTVSFSITATDPTGNDTTVTAVNDTSAVTVDTTAPTLVADDYGISHNRDVSAGTAAVGDAAHAGVGDEVTIDFGFSETIKNAIGDWLADGDVVIKIVDSDSAETQLANDRITLSHTADTNQYKAKFTVASGDPSGKVKITFSGLTDLAGNTVGGTLTKSFNDSMIILNADPSFVTSGFDAAATISDNAAATSPVASDVTSTDSNGNALTTSVSIPNNTNFKVAGTYSITWTAVDSAGQSANTSVDYVISDDTGPTLTVDSIVSGNSTTTVATSGDTITVVISSDQDIKADSLSITIDNVAGTPSISLDETDAKKATVTVDIGNSDAAGVINISALSCKDINDVASATFTATTKNDAVIVYVAPTAFDTAPDTSITYSIDNSNYTGAATGTLLEAIGAALNDSNGTAITLALTGDSADISGIANSNHNVTFTVKVDGTDPAGNKLESGDITITTVDASAPTAASAAVVNSTTITITFDEDIQLNGVLVPADFVIDSSIAVSGASADGAVLTLTTAYNDPDEGTSAMSYDSGNSFIIRKQGSGSEAILPVANFANFALTVPGTYASVTAPTVTQLTITPGEASTEVHFHLEFSEIITWNSAGITVTSSNNNALTNVVWDVANGTEVNQVVFTGFLSADDHDEGGIDEIKVELDSSNGAIPEKDHGIKTGNFNITATVLN